MSGGRSTSTDPVHRFIPQWRDLSVQEVAEDGSVRMVPPSRPMSIRDALMHMTGLPGSVVSDHPVDDRFAAALQDARSGMTLEGVCTLLADFPLKFQPGHPLELWVVDRCLRPPGRGHLRATLRRLPPTTRSSSLWAWSTPASRCPTGRRAASAASYFYQSGAEPRLVDDPETSPYRRPRSYLSGAGGLVSTSADYLRFCQMLLGNGELDGHRIIGRKTLELMTVNHLPGGGDLEQLVTGGFGESGFEGVGFGLGFAIGLGPAATGTAGSYGEFYWGGAASTAFWVDPVEEVTVVFMAQLLPSTTYPFRAQLRALVYQALLD